MPPTTWNGRTPDTDACAFASVLPGQLPDPTRAAPDTAWNAEYLGRAVAALRDSGQTVDDELLAHISPAMTEPVRLHGTYSFDVDRELAELDPAGYRPLRAVAPNEETT